MTAVAAYLKHTGRGRYEIDLDRTSPAATRKLSANIPTGKTCLCRIELTGGS